MTCALMPLVAAETVTGTRFELGRAQTLGELLIACAVCLVLLVFVAYMYTRDARELNPALGVFLAVLRGIAFVGLLVLYLDPSWRTEREVSRPSRALLLVDASMSMGREDVSSPKTSVPVSRSQQVAEALESTDFLQKLRKTHDVVVWRFGQDLKRVVPLDKIKPGPAPDEDEAENEGGENGSGDAPAGGESDNAAKADSGKTPEQAVDWNEALKPTANETRLGQALRQLIHDERSSPVSGVIVASDGGQNAGITAEAALALAREAKIPIFTIGIGSDKKPENVRVGDLLAPARAYPGDRFTVTGYIQAQGMEKRKVTVELLSRPTASGPAAAASRGTGKLEGTEQIILGTDGEVVPVKFELTPGETGKRTLCLRVVAPKSDGDPDDNLIEEDVEVVDRKNRVLLVAGGPTREYRFLRTLLFRDKSTTLDVLLQTAQPGISQEADKILDDFPATRQEMYQYDCVVAFDPDWQDLSVSQTELLEGWVAEQGGGLIVIAGPVYTGKVINSWVQDSSMGKIRALYPVQFVRSIIVMDQTSHVADEPWPLDFTRAGMEADYLWLGDTPSGSQRAWAGFKGVFSHFPVRGAKPGATVLARFSDPRSGEGDQRAPYLVSQFYGSGRVFYAGSGEMWRLRAVDDTYFEQFYTKLIRHVSQGRLLRGSTRGVLLVGQQRYTPGNTVEIRAQLTNAQLQPLEAPGVAVQVIHQGSGRGQTVNLVPDPARLGTFVGQFTVLRHGKHQLELLVPESDDERLTQTIVVKVPKLEQETPQRNDALLSEMAKSTGGEYYVGMEQALQGTVDKKPVAALLKDKTLTSVLLDAPNREWKEQWLRWMLGLLCGVLFLEWLVRRLVKLA